MGCLQSKKETSDLHPNVFRVVNVDDYGEYLCSGQLEITENDLILYREGRESTVWPLHSLRRYGFEEGMFSFESGRRCETGEGMYAFKCRRASLLFRTLQQQILLKNVNPVSRLTASPQGRQTMQANVIHRSSIDNGQPNNVRPVINNNLPNIITDAVPRNVIQTPRSPSSADILEVMPLYPRAQGTSNQVTNVYQVRDFKREHNNNQNEVAIDTRHVYSNDLNRDLAILRNTLREETALNTMRDIEDETRFLESRYINESVNTTNIATNDAANNVTENVANNPISPTLSATSENYAQLSLEQQQQQQQQQQEQTQQPLQKELPRLYMNIVPNEANTAETAKSDVIPTTPLTPKHVLYCNVLAGNKSDINTYANLSLGELGDTVKNTKQMFSGPDHNQKFFESETFVPLSPVEEIEVNYAILDIDSNKDTLRAIRDAAAASQAKNETGSSSSKSRKRLASQCSVEKSTGVAPSAAIGYTTIDFDKTVALTSVAAGEEDVSTGMEGSRKTRHNSCNIILCGNGSPGMNDKNKMNS